MIDSCHYIAKISLNTTNYKIPNYTLSRVALNTIDIKLFAWIFFHFSPLLKVIDNLLMMGQLTDDDLTSLLNLVDPEAFDDLYTPNSGKTGILSMKLEEPVKYQVICSEVIIP